jgi:hypothetical protein
VVDDAGMSSTLKYAGFGVAMPGTRNGTIPSSLCLLANAMQIDQSVLMPRLMIGHKCRRFFLRQIDQITGVSDHQEWNIVLVDEMAVVGFAVRATDCRGVKYSDVRRNICASARAPALWIRLPQGAPATECAKHFVSRLWHLHRSKIPQASTFKPTVRRNISPILRCLSE